MFRRSCEILKGQRLARVSAVIVGLILITVLHAPILPVVAGCILALGITVIRGLSRETRSSSARGSQ